MSYPIFPNCYCPLEAEFVDIGVGEQRIEPWHCLCGYNELVTLDFLISEHASDEIWKAWRMT